MWLSKDRYVSHEIDILKSLAGPNVAKLARWMERNIKAPEVIDVSCWIGDLFYLTIRDQREQQYPDNMIVGFTVHLKDDVVFWSHDQRYAAQGFTRGGNCFVRSERWHRKTRKQFPAATFLRWYATPKSAHTTGMIHDYRPLHRKSVSMQ